MERQASQIVRTPTYAVLMRSRMYVVLNAHTYVVLPLLRTSNWRQILVLRLMRRLYESAYICADNQCLYPQCGIHPAKFK